MDVTELAGLLERSGVAPDRYVISPLITDRKPWQLRSPGGVWLDGDLDGRWSVSGGGIAPHYSCLGALVSYGSEDEACRAFAAELTRTDGEEPYAESKAAASAERVRAWWEGEVRIALEEPEVAACRRRWRETWCERESVGEAAMTIPELLDALTECGMDRRLTRVEGLDDIGPDDGGTRVLRRDDRGRWLWGRWPTDLQWTHRWGAFTIRYRFATEAELCKNYFDCCLGPWEMSPALTLEQWHEQIAVVSDDQEAVVRAGQEHRRRVLTEAPQDFPQLALRLRHREVASGRYAFLGPDWPNAYGPHTDPDAVVLAHDPEPDAWWVEARFGGQPVELRRFASRAEAFRVFEDELTRPDGASFAAERAAARDRGQVLPGESPLSPEGPGPHGPEGPGPHASAGAAQG